MAERARSKLLVDLVTGGAGAKVTAAAILFHWALSKARPKDGPITVST